ncbi:MAG: glycosyltransferase family 4 protein [Blastocatellia bacterium]
MVDKKIKIAYLVDGLSVGGVERVVLDICASIDPGKFDVGIFSLSDRIDRTLTCKLNSSIKIKNYAYKYDGDYSLWGYLKHAFYKSDDSAETGQIISDVASFQPDILHVHLTPRELYLGIAIRDLIKCRLLYTQHSLYLRKGSVRALLLGIIFRKTFRKCDLIAVSAPIREQVLRHKLLGRGRKLFLVENKLNLSLYTPKQKQLKNEIAVVYVARICQAKAQEDLIRAWGRLKFEPLPKRLLLVGPDGMNGKMQALARDLEIDKSVEFMGVQYEVPGILNECDIAVFPSHHEGAPLALLEKMAMRLPVIVSDIPELTSIVTNGENGLTFRCGDIDDLAEKISILLSDVNLRERLGRRARETVERRFGCENMAVGNELIYEKLYKLPI